jgi:hypothetical protein
VHSAAHLVRPVHAVWGEGTAFRAASERLGPILLTAAITGLGLLPVALGVGRPGARLNGPSPLVFSAAS